MVLLAKHGGELNRTKFVHTLNIGSVSFKKLISMFEISNLIESEWGEHAKSTYHLIAA